MAFNDISRFGLRVIALASLEPVSLNDAKGHLNIPLADTHEDAWINAAIHAAREWCEGWSGRSLATQELELSLENFTGRREAWFGRSTPSWDWQQLNLFPEDNLIILPMGPVQSITSVSYYDADGTQQTLSSGAYTLDNWAEPHGIYRSFGSDWPTTQGRRNAVQIRYIAGHTAPGTGTYPLPYSLRAAILLVLGHLHENRENTTDATVREIPLSAQALMEQYRYRMAMA